MYSGWESQAGRFLVTHYTGLLQRGRFELAFADGSWIALVASVPTHAEPFAAQVGG